MKSHKDDGKSNKKNNKIYIGMYMTVSQCLHITLLIHI